ncbi:hypothetical protein CJO66_29420 [Burkholderia ubonensis]|nr:hypothetical protein CJO66_29420 [Burkholderia ubonensis]
MRLASQRIWSDLLKSFITNESSSVQLRLVNVRWNSERTTLMPEVLLFAHLLSWGESMRQINNLKK